MRALSDCPCAIRSDSRRPTTSWQARSADKTWVPIALMGGFAEVENNEVIVLVNGAERGDSIDRNAARAAYTAAESRFNQLQPSTDKQEQIQATQAMKRARARLQAAGGGV